MAKEKNNKSENGKVDEILAIASSRGFFFQTAGIYGGKAGFFTYGHLGKSLKTNWENLWRKHILNIDENFYEIQSNSILPEDVFKASGHIENFNDPLSECRKCHLRFRVDQFLEENGVANAESLTVEEMQDELKKRGMVCTKCGGELSDVKQFNMMFPVSIGFSDDKAYLSPETAQGAYLAFKEEFGATRGKLPLGLAVIDKAYRNEISPRKMFFRLREFTQAELQIFFDPQKINEHKKWDSVKDYNLYIKFANKEDVKPISCQKLNADFKIPKFYLYHAVQVQEFYLNVLKIPKEKFRLRELNEKERAFYNKIHFDVEVFFDIFDKFEEVGGIHYRADHDLSGHASVSKKNLEVLSDDKKVLPHVLELSFGVDRNVLAMLDVFYYFGKEGSMLRLPPAISPVKAAIFPIIKKPEFENIAENVVNILRKDWNVAYDKSGSIGRRYARNDEIGTPYCITIDSESPKSRDVTIRDRDTTKQIRVKINSLREVIRQLVEGEVSFEEAGVLVK